VITEFCKLKMKLRMIYVGTKTQKLHTHALRHGKTYACTETWKFIRMH